MSQLSKYIVHAEGNSEIVSWINTVLRSYFKTNPESQTEIEHILDFLKSERAPKRLRKMSFAQAKNLSEKWNKTLIKKGNNVIELDTDVEVIYTFKTGGRLVRLVGEAAYKREGAMMRHCVASYYGKETSVYSLRDTKNQSHCTIEVTKGEDNKVQQIKGKGNGSIHPKYVKAVLKSLKVLGADIRLNEMKNLGYIDLEEVTPNLNLFIETEFNGSRFITMQNVKLFYVYSILTPKKK
jgi:hypothetical protein